MRWGSLLARCLVGSVLAACVVAAAGGPAAAAERTCSEERGDRQDVFSDPPRSGDDILFHTHFLHFTRTLGPGGQTTLFVWGGICEGDSEIVRQVVDMTKPIREVIFFSGGGNLEEGLEIGRILRREKVATRLRSSDRCISACNFMFMGGVIRTIEPGGEFGVHMFVNEGYTSALMEVLSDSEKVAAEHNKKHPEDKVDPEAVIHDNVFSLMRDIQQEDAKTAAEIGRFLLNMQLSLRFLTEFANIPNEHYRGLTRDELRDFNIVNSD